MLSISYKEEARETVCVFEGELRSDNCAKMAKELDDFLASHFGPESVRKLPDTETVIFDLKDTEFVSSVFMRIVLVTAKKVPNGQFKVVNCNAFVQELFRTSGLDMFLADHTSSLESSVKVSPVIEPPAAFAASSLLAFYEDYEKEYSRSVSEPEAFWNDKAREDLVWDRMFDEVLDWQCPNAAWFKGGRLNVSVNCLDKHMSGAIANKAALIWEGEPCSATDPGETRVLTYRQLYREVCRFANVLKRHGVGRGDRVIIYMPMVPEAAIAMLACTRVGAVHSVVFGGFSAAAIADRVHDCGAKMIITADGSYRKGAVVPLKKNVDEALTLKGEQGQNLGATVQTVVVMRRTGLDVHIHEGRDVWWHQELDYVDANCPPESMESEDLLFILYTSGSTGKPKGIMHTTAGYLLGCMLSHRYIFDLKDTDIYWCTADVGWITGHSYVVYGPLANGATVFMYEGAPNYPEPDRFWAMVEKYSITTLYTAPTAIRAFMQWGDEWPEKHDLSSLRLLGTVGEPINPHAWLWYHEKIGGGRCPIVDTWWQTETGSIMISTFPGAMSTKPGSAGKPLYGVCPEVVDDEGQTVPAESGGKLIMRRPWPSMLRGVWGDADRFLWTYWKEFPGVYFTGDGARCDQDGYFWIMGRIDDVINVSGHRIGTAEVESALVSHPSVAEAAVVGRADDVKGAALVAFVTLKKGQEPTPELRNTLKQHVVDEMGPVTRPDEIRFAESLPKTRSGKIMRRLLKQVAAGTEIVGDLTTLEDFGVLERLSGEES